MAAVERIAEICNTFGVNWINTYMPKLTEIIAKDPCFHFKIASVYSLKEICMSVHGEAYL